MRFIPSFLALPLARAGAAFAVAATLCTAPAVAASDIVLGQIGPFTGLPVTDAHEINQGIKAYVNAVNKAGGIRGAKVTFFEIDDRYSPDGFVAAFGKAMEKKPLALLTPVGSAALTRMLKDRMLDDADVVIVNAVPGAETLRNPGHPKLFHIRVGDKEQIEKIVAHTRTLGMTRLAALYQDIPVGTSAMAGAQEEVKRASGMQISGVKSGMNPAQLAAAAAEVQKLDAQCVLVLGAPPFMANGVAALRKAGVSQSIFVRSDVPAGLIVKLAGPQGARGVGVVQTYPNPNVIRLPLVREFRAAMKASYPQLTEYTPFQLEGYVSVRVVAEALKRSKEREFTPTALAKALHALKDIDLGGYGVNFADGQIGSRWVDIAVIGSDGRLHY